jgi:multidrug resistance efflux pump
MNDPAELNHPASDNGAATLSDRVRSLRLGNRPQARAPRRALVPWALCLVLLLTTVAFAYRSYRGAPEAATGPGPSTAVAASGEVVLQAKGYVIPVHQIQLSPQVGGEIIWLDPRFLEGAVYKQGDRLAEIDPVIYAARLESAEAALAVAKINLREVETGSALDEIRVAEAQVDNLAARLKLSQIDYENKDRAGRATSRDDLAKAKVQVVVDAAAHHSQKQALAKLKVALEERRLVARAQVRVADAAVKEARKQLKNCTITAPTTGIVLTKKAELGGYVNPLAFGAAGYLCEMADLRDLEIDLSIQERDIAGVTEGQACEVMPEAYQADKAFLARRPKGYQGVVSRLMPMADRAKGAIPVRVRIDRAAIPPDEAGKYLRPDMAALVSFKKAGAKAKK